MRLLGSLGLLVVLAAVVLGPGLSESRKVRQPDLKAALHKRLHLHHSLQDYKASIIDIIVCEVGLRTPLRTDSVKVLGTRKPLAAKNKKSASMTLPPTTAELTTVSTAESDYVETGSREKRSVTLMEDEGSGMYMTMEDILNQEEDKFNEGEMFRDDNAMGPDSSEENESHGCNSDSNEWSLGYYGVFLLTDSRFCCSGHRWSRNVCKIDCKAFTDDDISDDVDCFVKSGVWRFILRTASDQCLKHSKLL